MPEPLCSIVIDVYKRQGYCGTATIDDLRANGEFIRITNNGLTESHPHDISITKEAPNYSVRG